MADSLRYATDRFATRRFSEAGTPSAPTSLDLTTRYVVYRIDPAGDPANSFVIGIETGQVTRRPFGLSIAKLTGPVESALSALSKDDEIMVLRNGHYLFYGVVQAIRYSYDESGRGQVSADVTELAGVWGAQRLVKPTDGNQYQEYSGLPADDLIKDVWEDNVGASAAASRQIADFAAEGDKGEAATPTETWRMRYEAINQVLPPRARNVGVNYWMWVNPADPEGQGSGARYRLRTQVRADRSHDGSEQPVIFDERIVRFPLEVELSTAGEKNEITVGGPGIGTSQAVTTVTSGSPTGKSLKEGMLLAGESESANERTAFANYILDRVGSTIKTVRFALAQSTGDEDIAFHPREPGYGNFDVLDLVDFYWTDATADLGGGLTISAENLEITEIGYNWGAREEIALQIGWPEGFEERIQDEAKESGSNRSGGSRGGGGGGAGRGGGGGSGSGGGPAPGASDLDISFWDKITDGVDTVSADVGEDTLTITESTAIDVVLADDPESITIAMDGTLEGVAWPTGDAPNIDLNSPNATIDITGVPASNRIDLDLAASAYAFGKVTDGVNTAAADVAQDTLTVKSTNSTIGITVSDTDDSVDLSIAAAGYAYGTAQGDTGSADAASAGDTLKIAGGDGITTTAADGTPDTVTVAVDSTVTRYAFKTISTPAGTSPVADVVDDTLTLAVGGAVTITGDSATDTVTISETHSSTDHNYFKTVSGDTGSAVADQQADTLTVTGGTGIATTASDVDDSVTVDLDATLDGVSWPSGAAPDIDLTSTGGTVTITPDDVGKTINFEIGSSGYSFGVVQDDATPTPNQATADSAQDTLTFKSTDGTVGITASDTDDSVDLSVTASALPYATPALTLGTANAEGTADTVIRSDATIAVFDATTPADVGAAGATGSASVAARRDHVHRGVASLTESTGITITGADEPYGALTIAADFTESTRYAFKTVTGDTGSAAAEIVDDSLAIVGGDGVTTTASDVAGADQISVAVDFASTSTDVSGSASAGGSAVNAAREDHTHQGVHSLAKSGDTALYGDVTLSAGTGVALTEAGQDIEIAIGSGGYAYGSVSTGKA